MSPALLRSLLPLLALAAVAGCESTDSAGADAAASADAERGAQDADPDSPDAATATGCDFDNSVDYDLLGETLQLASEDGRTCVKLTRRNDCSPDEMCKAAPFTLLTFRAAHAGESFHLDDTSKLQWEGTHHNWSDWGEALSGGVRYRLESRIADDVASGDYDIGRYQFFASNEDSRVALWGPIDLFPHVP